ncbi:hypothetical protein [Halopiger djelfimassiliensis]|nr:hypothetical protein [Halopiger djelfimassiliensis]
MDSKRPDIRLDESPDEDGIVTKTDADTDGAVRSFVRTLRDTLRR